MLDGDPKFVAIDEEADHQIVHRRRFGKANRTTHEPLDPRPQVDVLTLDFLRVLFAHVMLLWRRDAACRRPSHPCKIA